MKIRKVTISDVCLLLPLIEQLGDRITEEDLTARLGLYTHSTVDRAWVMEADNEEIVGCIAVHCYDLFHSSDRYARITSLIVKESHRRQGIGRRLVARAEKYALTKNCTALELSSPVKNHQSGSHDFFVALEYRNDGAAEVLYLRKLIEPAEKLSEEEPH
jgi:N-acetylglutamate synthase-like GNAT family acetyltransferase